MFSASWTRHLHVFMCRRSFDGHCLTHLDLLHQGGALLPQCDNTLIKHALLVLHELSLPAHTAHRCEAVHAHLSQLHALTDLERQATAPCCCICTLLCGLQAGLLVCMLLLLLPEGCPKAANHLLSLCKLACGDSSHLVACVALYRWHTPTMLDAGISADFLHHTCQGVSNYSDMLHALLLCNHCITLSYAVTFHICARHGSVCTQGH
jgi:hypothetical protein